MSQNNNKRPFVRNLVYVLLAAVIAAALALGLRKPPVVVEAAVVTRAPLRVSFTEEGRTRVIDRYLISAPFTGQVERVELEPGDAVAAGQVVAVLRPAASALLDPATRAQLQAQSRAAGAGRDSARARVRAAESAAAIARSEWQRLDGMRSAVSAMELERTRSTLQSASAELEAARAAQRQSVDEVAAIDARLQLQGEGGERSTIELRAPVAGVVLRRLIESAAPVQAGQAMLEVGDRGALEVEVDVLSSDAVRLRPGMRALLHRWGGDQPLDGSVERVEPSAFTKISALGVEEQRVHVIVTIATPPAQWQTLGDAYRVEAEFVVDESADALQLPSSALYRRGERWAVFVVEGDHVKEREVKVGRVNPRATEIVQGVAAAETVVVHPDDRIADGSRVRVAVEQD